MRATWKPCCESGALVYYPGREHALHITLLAEGFAMEDKSSGDFAENQGPGL
jgi:hypothetical protein